MTCSLVTEEIGDRLIRFEMVDQCLNRRRVPRKTGTAPVMFGLELIILEFTNPICRRKACDRQGYSN